MSGIAGIYYLDDRPVASEDLGRMVDILAHRGQDEADVWQQGSVGLGHRMLWTTPESLLEKLPLVSQSGDLVITADARIDNRDRLISKLELSGLSTEKITDSQLILAAYRKWGEHCPEELVGDFAFAIWDDREQKLFCARDPMGVKPFCYYRSDRLFAFASEPKALLCLSEIPRQLNELRVAYHLVGCFEDKTSTFYQSILRLPGAHCLTIDRQNARLRSYWSVDFSHYERFSSREDYAEAFRELFTEAVRCRMRSAFPIGSMLSGGLDSSSIACVMRNLLAENKSENRSDRLPTFSYVFPTVAAIDPRIDERRYMNAVLETGGFQPHYIEADTLSPLMDRNQVSWHLDGAYPAPNLFMDWALFKAVQQQGVRVLFTGHDGDTTVSYGHECLAALARSGRWIRLVQEAKGLSKGFYKSQTSAKKLIRKYGFAPLVPESIGQFWDNLRGRSPQPQWATNHLINPAFASRLNLAERVEALYPPTAKTAKEDHWYGVTNGLLQYCLQSLDELASAVSVELRHPFCDQRLIEFCISVPPEQKLDQGWTRAVMRRSMLGILPPAVQQRTDKANLSSNFNLKLFEHEQKTLEKVFHQAETIAEYVDLSFLQGAYDRYAAQPLQANQDSLLVFLAANLSLWLEETELSASK